MSTTTSTPTPAADTAGSTASPTTAGLPSRLHHTAYVTRAMILEQDHQYLKAANDYAHLIAKYPNDNVSWNNRCWNRAIGGDLAPALADCQHALKLVPNDPTTLDSLGFVYLKLHDNHR